ncbi:tetratricopeptide repeat protein [Reticulibacter mediterranei]|uniref:tetratricopeptide repeat protein n=1 Tax=Reticulibacter mediterranei TaxID=2778369 RepID=UPI0027E417BE|nr:tetratricopeptide repeat protein [Reticulibacter mediterranei]
MSSSLAIQEAQVGVPNPDTATSLNNLGMLYRDQSRYAEAEPLLQRAVMICQVSFGVEHDSCCLI